MLSCRVRPCSGRSRRRWGRGRGRGGGRTGQEKAGREPGLPHLLTGRTSHGTTGLPGGRGDDSEKTVRLATQLWAGGVAARLEEAARGYGLLELDKEVTWSWWCTLGKSCGGSMIRGY